MDVAGKRVELCCAEDVAVGAVRKVDVRGMELAVYNLDGAFYVTDDHCTHGPGQMSEGEIYGDLVQCNFHGGMFNIRTGEVAGPPCWIPIRIYQVVIDEGKVFIVV